MPAWSPDGQKIAFVSHRDDGFGKIYNMNADGTGVNRLTTFTSLVSNNHPAWSTDGTKIAFASTRDGTAKIWVMNADGTNPTRLTSTAADEITPSWTR